MTRDDLLTRFARRHRFISQHVQLCWLVSMGLLTLVLAVAR